MNNERGGQCSRDVAGVDPPQKMHQGCVAKKCAVLRFDCPIS